MIWGIMLMIRFLLSFMVLFTLSTMISACADFGLSPQFKAEVVMENGKRVRLFYGGTQEARNIFCKGETVSVFRTYPTDPDRFMEVGKVKIVGELDRDYLEGVVVEGSVMEGDLARKSIAACMIRPFR
jgi:hypothetical protein